MSAIKLRLTWNQINKLKTKIRRLSIAPDAGNVNSLEEFLMGQNRNAVLTSEYFMYWAFIKLRATKSMFVHADSPQPVFTCSKSIIERPEECVKSAQR